MLYSSSIFRWFGPSHWFPSLIDEAVIGSIMFGSALCYLVVVERLHLREMEREDGDEDVKLKWRWRDDWWFGFMSRHETRDFILTWCGKHVASPVLSTVTQHATYYEIGDWNILEYPADDGASSLLIFCWFMADRWLCLLMNHQHRFIPFWPSMKMEARKETPRRYGSELFLCPLIGHGSDKLQIKENVSCWAWSREGKLRPQIDKYTRTSTVLRRRRSSLTRRIPISNILRCYNIWSAISFCKTAISTNDT